MWHLLYSPFLLLLFLFSWIMVESGRRRVKKYPPGPWPWPVIGNILEIRNANADYPHLAFNIMAEKYGPVMTVGFGVHRTVVLSSYAAIKQVMSKAEVVGRYVLPSITFHSGGESNTGIVFANGQSCKELGRFTLSTLKEFGFGRRSKMELLQQEEAAKLTSSLLKNMQSSKDGTIFLQNLDFAESTVNILWGFIAGFQLPLGDPVVRTTIDYVNQLCHIAGLSNLYNPFPWVKTLMPEWSGHKTHSKVYEGYRTFIKGMVEKVRNGSKIGKYKDSFIHRFLEQADRNNYGSENYYTEGHLIMILMELIVAGTEANSSTLMWVMLYLAKYPEKQYKLFDEIKQVLGFNVVATHADECRMPFTKSCIMESQCMGNVLPYGLPRLVLKGFKARDFNIPEGAMVLHNLHSVFRDKGYWSDADVYRPERFLDGNSQILAERAERIGTVFGAGRRMCVGESVAMRTIFIYVTALFAKFQFSVIPGSEPTEVALPRLINLRPSNFYLNIKVRK